MDLDKVMDEVGQFGKFQGLCYFLLSFSIFYSAIAGIGYVFPTGMVNYRCRIPECEENDVKYAQDWLKNAVPYKDDMPSRCERYSPRNKTNPLDGILNNETVCTADLFDNTTRIPCEEYLFDDEEWLLVNEWKITSCTGKHWKQTLVGTINNVGQFIGFPLAGYFSDRYGRKATLMVSTLVTCVLGLLRSVAWNYEIFLFSEFLVAGFSGGIYNSGFVLGLELVGPKARVIGGAIISTFYSAGMVILAAVAWWSKNWRLMQAMYAPGLICIIYYWLLPESVRWLQSQGRNDEVKKIMKRAAKINGVQLSDQEFNKFELAPVVSEKPDEEKPAPARSKGEAFKKVFQSRILLARLVNCAFCWITNSFVYIGLSLSAVSIGGGKYTNFMLVAVVEIPAYAATPFFSDRFGRRLSLCVSLLIAGVCCVCFAFIPEDYDTAKLVVFLAGKFAITVAFTVVFVCTAELFPTELRHSMLGTCSMVGRVGSIIAPQTPLLAEIFKSLPFFLFGGMSVASGLLILMIPETLNQKLPDTVEEAENLGRKPQNT